MEYANTKVGLLPAHKFTHYTQGDDEATLLPGEETGARSGRGLRYSVDVYVDNFMSIVIPTSKAQLDHIANAIMRGIHDVFPADIINSNDPILEKKLKRGGSVQYI
jgi:hypothetical protein